ncbi:hypothetical protein Tco_0109428 [Tanacetum coccineum]
MRRVGKGFSSRVTPLFQTIVVQNQSQLGEGSTIPTDPHHTPTFIQPSTQPQKTQQPRKPKRKDTQIPQPSDPIENVTDEAVLQGLKTSCSACLRLLLLIEPVKPIKKKDLIRLDEEAALKLKAEFDEEERLKRRKHFAAKIAEEKRNKPPTKAQQRKIMCAYLKNMEGYKLKDLKLKEFDSIQPA